MSRPIAVTITLWILLGAATAGAQVHQTPASRSASQIEPAAWTLANPREVLDTYWRATDIESSAGQGYDVFKLVQMEEKLTPDVTLGEVKAALNYGDGIFAVAGHGREDRFYAELYPGTSEGQAAMEAAYWEYWYDPLWPNETFIWGGGLNDGYYGIAITPAGIESWFESANSIVYMAVCRSNSYSNRWVGAREVLDYNYDVEVNTVESDAELFWGRMNGESGKAFREVGAAAAGLSLIHTGNGGTVLSPTVESYYPDEFTSIGEDSVLGWAVFDTKMDILMDPAMAVFGDGNLNVRNEEWVRGEKDTLRYTLKSVHTGPGEVHINDYAMSEGGTSLDGNQEPPGTDGVGPNRDDYVISYVCTHGSGNPAALAESQWAYREGAGVVVGWHSVAEWNTKSYTVEGGDGVSWETVGKVSRGEVMSPGIYEVSVPDGYRYYRIVELDKTGKRCEFRPVTVPASGGRSLAGIIKAGGLSKEPNRQEMVPGEDLCWEPVSARSAGAHTFDEVPDWVFYGPDSLLAETTPAVAWFESKGLTVDTVWSPSPDP